jgi:N-acetyl-anhydromuramyl-L-alanine amidase AmpD
VRDGREPPDPHPLPGPLSQLFLSRSGVFHVLAAGLCNHAGAGLWHGVTQGNHELIGIEAENAGTGLDPWPPVQMAAYTLGVAAILEHIGADGVMAAGHKEYALPKGRKTDPSFDMVMFRAHVEAIMGNAASPVPGSIALTDPKRDMLRKGDQGESVRQLQRLLGIKIDGGFGPLTDRAVRAFQHAHGLKDDGLVGPQTWQALGL